MLCLYILNFKSWLSKHLQRNYCCYCSAIYFLQYHFFVALVISGNGNKIGVYNMHSMLLKGSRSLATAFEGFIAAVLMQ